MRLLVQRVKRASVTVEGDCVGKIEGGFLILVGVAPEDDEAICTKMAQKVVAMRVFEDADGKMNKSVTDIGGSLLAVSQFTLYADCRKGNRPSFTGACEPQKANRLYEYFCKKAEALGVKVERGVFGADMQVELINDGPVTIMLDSDEIVKR